MFLAETGDRGARVSHDVAVARMTGAWVQRQCLGAGVDDRPMTRGLPCRAADDGGDHPRRAAIWSDAAVPERIVVVEDVGARSHLGDPRHPWCEPRGRSRADADVGDLDTLRADALGGVYQGSTGVLSDGGDFIRATEAGMTLVGHDAGETQPWQPGDGDREIDGLLTGTSSGPILAGIYLDVDIENAVTDGDRLRQCRGRLVRVDRDNDVGALEQFQETPHLDIADDGVGDQNIGDASQFDEHLGLAELGAGQPDRACLQLQPGDVWALVRLGVWSQCYAMAGRERSHLGNIAFEQVEIDGDERGVEFLVAGDDAMIDLRGNRARRTHAGDCFGVIAPNRPSASGRRWCRSSAPAGWSGAHRRSTPAS